MELSYLRGYLVTLCPQESANLKIQLARHNVHFYLLNKYPQLMLSAIQY